MKKHIAIFLLLSMCVLTAGAQQFDLKGKIQGQDSGYLQIYYQGMDGKGVSDSSAIKDGSFEFKGAVNGPTMAYFYGAIKSRAVSDPNSTDIFLEPGDMTITLSAGHFKEAVITGSKTQNESVELEKRKAAIYAEEEPLRNAFNQINVDLSNAKKNHADEKTIKDILEKGAVLHDKFDPYNKRSQKIDMQYFDEHPQSYLTVWDLQYYTSSLPLDSLELFYNRLGAKLQQSAPGIYIGKTIKRLHAGLPGTIAADFTSTELNGKTLTLSSLKGKYVILDFWASWCVPCRHSNPHMIELYNKYHSKGLDVIGIASDDDNNAAWNKAVTDDKVGIWHNVLDGYDRMKGMRGEDTDASIGNKYGIQTLPTKIIIDPNGKIVGRYGDNIGGSEEDMDKLLASVYNK
jgi:thiol-disulfide isomerase/thioredoxin